MPLLRGKPLDQAQLALAQAGLTVTVRGVNANADKNVVVDQSPTAGATLQPGATVALQVGTGSTAIPDVSGQPRDMALQTLQDNSFRIRERSQRDARIPAGAAVGTNPPAGAVVPRNAEVELDLSTGPWRLTTSQPDCVALDIVIADDLALPPDTDAHGTAVGETRPVPFATRPVLQGTLGDGCRRATTLPRRSV